MRTCTPNPARLWIDRQAVAAMRAERELGQTPDPARPMFKLWTPNGPIISARRVYWFGATEAIFDPARPSMLEHASVWIETTAPVMADGEVYAAGRCDTDSYLDTDGVRQFPDATFGPHQGRDPAYEPPAANTPMDREITD